MSNAIMNHKTTEAPITASTVRTFRLIQASSAEYQAEQCKKVGDMVSAGRWLEEAGLLRKEAEEGAE